MKDFFQVVPVKNCEFEVNNNLVTVLFKKTKPSFVEKLFFKKQLKEPYKIDLDEIGSYVWRLIDGKKNISEIIELSSQHFGKKIEPAKERVELFIKQLHKNKLISLYRKVE